MGKKLNVWLYKNQLTDDPNDFSGVIESPGTLYVDDIIEELRRDGMDIKAETAKAVVTRFNSRCLDRLTEGYHVHNGLVQMHASIKGVFHDKTWNPAKHSIHVTIAQGAEMRKAIAETTVEIAGEHPDPIVIFSLTDTSTGKTDGTLTANHVAEIKGNCIKIAGDDPACGLFLRDIVHNYDYRIPAANIAVNDPSRILFTVFDVETTNPLELRVVTQYSKGSRTLNLPRTAICPLVVFVHPEEAQPPTGVPPTPQAV
jgi:hypothetical protein